MDLNFEVKRTRPSVTQGFVDVYCNGKHVSNFNDEIKLVKDGQKYYGDIISGYASQTPDKQFIKSTLWHPFDNIYNISEEVKKIVSEG